MFIRGNVEILRLNSASAADLEVNLDVLQVNSAAPPVVQAIPTFGPQASITGTGNTTLLSAAGLTAGHYYKVNRCSIYNNHASQASVVRVERNDGSNTAIEANVNLLAGETLLYDEGGWYHLDANLGLYPAVLPVATQTEMEAGASLVKTVTPGNQHFHQSATKFWVEFINGGTIETGYNVSSITDGAAGVATVNIANDFSSVDWACFIGRAEDDLTFVYSVTYDAKAAGSVIVRSVVEAGSGSDPSSGSGNASWSVSGMGDL